MQKKLMRTTDLSAYDNFPYRPDGGLLRRILWFYVNALFFKTSIFPFSAIKVFLLRLFGAKIGQGVVIKPCVNIKQPRLLHIGNHCWLGEKVWIDNLVMVTIGHHVCLSQGALLLTGSHNYKTKAFNLITGSIILEDGAWIGAGAIVNQGITVSSHAVLSAGSVATRDLEPYQVYQGNPAVQVRPRLID